MTQELSTVKALFSREDVKSRFDEMLGKKSQGFITSVLQIVASNELLQKAEPMSVYNSAAVAATLDLPINNNLGFAYIVPYKARQKDGTYKNVAQFQIGYKGFIQLAQRSGMFQTISAKAVYEGQMVDDEGFDGFKFNWKSKHSDTIIGYAAYFKLLNGFEKTFFMSIDDLKKHGVRYSQTFKKGFGLWKDDFEAMAIKTVIKLLLSKYAPLSIEMQHAVIYDQSIINNEYGTDWTYVDNEPVVISPNEVAKTKERGRLIDHINKSQSKEQLMQVKDHIDYSDDELVDIFSKKLTLYKHD